MAKTIHESTMQSGHSTIWSLLNNAMERIPNEGDRWNLRSEAEAHKAALLDTIQLIGGAIDSIGLAPSEISKLGGFLACAPELIKSMDALIAGYEEMQAITREGVDHE